jgi:CubicO group peptidase (beta-lactamase class C family)
MPQNVGGKVRVTTSRSRASFFWTMLAVMFVRSPATFTRDVGISRAGKQSRAQNPAMPEKIDAIFAPLVTEHSPGLAVLVIKDGKKLFERGYGVRDLQTAAKIDAHTNFRLASCSKQFTAMAIMLLVHDGKIRYDQSLTDIFPEFPAYGKSITIRNLLNHTAGLQDYESLMNQADAPNSFYPFPPQWTEKKQIQDAEVLTLLEQTDHAMFPPATQWYYSNSGYLILGLVVAKISGQPFADFLQQRIFAPLKMHHTVAYQQGKNQITNRAYGHTKAGNTWQQTDQSPTSATLGDGGIYSSLEDLAKWEEALRTNRLLSKEEMQPALAPVRLKFTSPSPAPCANNTIASTNPAHTESESNMPSCHDSQPRWPADSDRPEGAPVSYGFGWFVDPYEGHSRMWHYGETQGFHSYIVRFPNDRLTIMILCNRTDITPETRALQVADELLSLTR